MGAFERWVMQLLAVPVQRDEMYCQSGLVTLRRQGKRCDAGCWCWGASGDVLTQLGGCVNMATRPCVGAAAVSVGRAGWLVAGALRECVCVLAWIVPRCGFACSLYVPDVYASGARGRCMRAP